MADTLEVKRDDAVRLLKGLGHKKAAKWDDSELEQALNAIDEEPDEPLDDEELDDLLDELLDTEEAIIVPSDDDIEGDDEESDKSLDEDDEQEQEPKQKEKGKKMAKSKRKDSKKTAKNKAKSKTKTRAPKKDSIDAVTMKLLEGRGMTIDRMLNTLVKKFPDCDADTLRRTTKRRLTGYLQQKHGIKIIKSDKGVYSIA